MAQRAVQATLCRAYCQQGEVDGKVAPTMKENHYDSSTGILSLSAVDADAFKNQIAYWTDYL